MTVAVRTTQQARNLKYTEELLHLHFVGMVMEKIEYKKISALN